MFSPNKKKPNLHERMDQSKKESRPLTEEVKKRMWATVALTFILLFIYYGCIELGLAQAVMIAYFVVFTVVIVGYLIYNRAFVNKDVTADMLPQEWSEEKKQAFIEDNRIRAEKSRWVVVIIIPFAVVFMCEALYLFVWDGYLSELFKG
ncbi:MAG: hypothetical protein E7610_08270 [Ruminococcaceae bacterium]|nr:hypothetical protein [Oscillospiraceae bacterium]